jgi:hypothetical protein
MCYGIRELIGKKTRESNHPKIETMVRAWLKKQVPKGSCARQEEKASGGGISGIAGGVGRRLFPPPPGQWVDV